MRIRYGDYTLYKGYEMDLSESRDNYPGEERLFGLSYDANSNPKLEGFWKDQYKHVDGRIEKTYRKGIYLKDLDNAFVIQTKALYKGYVFDVNFSPPEPEENWLGLCIYDSEIAKKVGFTRSGTWSGKDMYREDITIDQIEKLWEERTPSTYNLLNNLPMPKGLEKIKVIFDRTKK